MSFNHTVLNIDESAQDIDVYKAQSIIAKQTKKNIEISWTDKQEDLLFTWSEKAAGYRWLHIRANEYYTNMSNLFTYPIIILSSLIGFGGMVVNKHELSDDDVIVLYALSGLNLVVATLSSLQKINRYTEKSEQHLSQSIQYAKFYREINMELSLERKERDNGVIFCKNSKYKYDNLLSVGLNVPRKIIIEFNFQFPNIMNRPDIANGLFDMNVKRKLYDLNVLYNKNLNSKT